MIRPDLLLSAPPAPTRYGVFVPDCYPGPGYLLETRHEWAARLFAALAPRIIGWRLKVDIIVGGRL